MMKWKLRIHLAKVFQKKRYTRERSPMKLFGASFFIVFHFDKQIVGVSSPQNDAPMIDSLLNPEIENEMVADFDLLK